MRSGHETARVYRSPPSGVACSLIELEQRLAVLGEGGALDWLGQDVSNVIGGGNVRHVQLALMLELAHLEVSAIDVP